MLHRKLGNTGIAVGKIALGTMYFGSETPEADGFAILDTFIEAGGNLVDTANVYVNGVSEEIIGRWPEGRNRPGCVGHQRPLQCKPGSELGWTNAPLAPSFTERFSQTFGC
jgi:predicted aldo/keto reductase-like oxidoreductase